MTKKTSRVKNIGAEAHALNRKRRLRSRNAWQQRKMERRQRPELF